jgi:nucleoside-diphosphate-sugar epimerase
MKVMIMGASGFLGSWATRVLASDHEIYAILRKNSDSFRIENLGSIKIIREDPNLWFQLIENIKPDCILLLNWSGVENSSRNSNSQFSNVDNYRALIDQAIKSKVPKIIGFGSQAELGPVSNSILESELDNPTTLYGKAKVECRKYGIEASKNTSTSFLWVRIFSTYGPKDSESWLIPSVILNLADSKPFNSTPGMQEWSFLHAYDFANAVKLIVECDSVQNIYNLGNPNTHTVKEVLSLIGDIMGKKDLIQFGAIPYRSDQVMKLKPVCESLIKLGWNPKVKLEAGLNQTINWYLDKDEAPVTLTDNESIFFDLPLKTKKHL